MGVSNHNLDSKLQGLYDEVSSFYASKDLEKPITLEQLIEKVKGLNKKLNFSSKRLTIENLERLKKLHQITTVIDLIVQNPLDSARAFTATKVGALFYQAFPSLKTKKVERIQRQGRDIHTLVSKKWTRKEAASQTQTTKMQDLALEATHDYSKLKEFGKRLKANSSLIHLVHLEQLERIKSFVQQIQNDVHVRDHIILSRASPLGRLFYKIKSLSDNKHREIISVVNKTERLINSSQKRKELQKSLLPVLDFLRDQGLVQEPIDNFFVYGQLTLKLEEHLLNKQAIEGHLKEIRQAYINAIASEFDERYISTYRDHIGQFKAFLDQLPKQAARIELDNQQLQKELNKINEEAPNEIETLDTEVFKAIYQVEGIDYQHIFQLLSAFIQKHKLAGNEDVRIPLFADIIRYLLVTRFAQRANGFASLVYRVQPPQAMTMSENDPSLTIRKNSNEQLKLLKTIILNDFENAESRLTLLDQIENGKEPFNTLTYADTATLKKLIENEKPDELEKFASLYEAFTLRLQDLKLDYQRSAEGQAFETYTGLSLACKTFLCKKVEVPPQKQNSNAKNQ